MIPFYPRISRIIFKICFSRSCWPSWATKQVYFGNFTHPQTHFDTVLQNRRASVRLHHWKRELLNLCESLMNCAKASLPYNRTPTSLSWLRDGTDLSIFMWTFMRISWISLKNWCHGRKCNNVSATMLQEHNMFKVCSKLCWNLCKYNWLNSNLNLVSNFVPTWSWRFDFH